MSKAPARRYPSDDLTITSGGESYAPHAGEWVEMRGGPSWDFLRDTATLTRLESLPFSELTSDDARALVDTLGRMLTFLATRITDWSWTGNDEQPLPKPTPEVLGSLEREEVLWLVVTLTQGATPGAAAESEKNA